MGDDPRDLLFIYALQNAVKHKSTPKAGTVIGLLMGKHPEFRTKAGDIPRIAAEVIDEVELLSHEERLNRLEMLAPDIIREMQESGRGQGKKGLPPLKNAEGDVVMRFAPNPSGPLHLGHSRAAYLNDEYVRSYGGKLILRIEDTDPRRVLEDAYSMVLEDIEWMGLEVSEIIYQSNRMEIYYAAGEELIRRGGAYVCICDQEEFRRLKLSKQACPCRANDPGVNLEMWRDMLSGAYAEGTITVRVKTDLEHPDPAIRDFSIFRIVDSPPHPRILAKVYPLMNLSVAVDDHENHMTHVIRGKDHIANTKRQEYIFDYLGWKPPQYIHYGRMSISGVVLSTSAMHEGIRKGEYSGWDDIRLGTLRAIAKRGIRPEAVRKAMIDIGTGDTDISFSWENLYAHNKAIVDPIANRYFFVPGPKEVEIEGAKPHMAKAALHPNEPGRGTRNISFNDRIYLPFAEIKGKEFVRLKDLFNIRITWEGDKISKASYAGDLLEEARAAKAPIIQWLPHGYAMPCTLRHPDGDLHGFCEPPVKEEYDRVVQFERIGFARIDSVDEGKVIAYWAHR